MRVTANAVNVQALRSTSALHVSPKFTRYLTLNPLTNDLSVPINPHTVDPSTLTLTGQCSMNSGLARVVYSGESAPLVCAENLFIYAASSLH